MLLSIQSEQALKLIGQMLKVARVKRGWSQQALAERMGVNRQTVAAIESGRASTAVGTVFEAAVLLGIPLLSHDEKQLSYWQTTLSNFRALFPERARKKPEVDNDF